MLTEFGVRLALGAVLLYGVKPLDGAAIGGAVLVLLGCSAVAALIPAQRAAAIDPMQALRAE